MLLTNFQSIRPPYETKQEEGLAWFAEAHVKSKGESFRQTIEEKLWHVGCKPHQIEKRGHVLTDFLHQNWEEMQIYRLHESPVGQNLSARMKVFDESVDQIFSQYYPADASPPHDLIHVSCTGYVSPSGAQKIVSKNGWGQITTVTHAYHMGCYASLPAIRMGSGFLGSSPAKERTDVVHTEICCLHSNPSLHALDQLVCQSLFGDGFMKYSLVKQCEAPHLKIESLREEIIPQSMQSMTWNVAEWGFQMSLAKEIAVLISRSLKGYLARLYPKDLGKAVFAIHPGGPKILNHIQELLGLSESQMRHSFAVLKEYGNMSSATLPHIWQRMLQDPEIPDQTPIISLAFGPGLTIAGAWMEKICGS